MSNYSRDAIEWMKDHPNGLKMSDGSDFKFDENSNCRPKLEMRKICDPQDSIEGLLMNHSWIATLQDDGSILLVPYEES